jgi:CDGSH-type Zn-finger protein
MTRSDSKARVTVMQNGPYVVTGSVKLSEQIIATDADGTSQDWIEKELPSAGPTFALCRCGHSNKKPFCDGSHVRGGFDGTEVADRTPFLDQAQIFDGPSLALLDVESLCAFARFCDANGQVWEPGCPYCRSGAARDVHSTGPKLSVGTFSGVEQG